MVGSSPARVEHAAAAPVRAVNGGGGPQRDLELSRAELPIGQTEGRREKLPNGPCHRGSGDVQ